MESRDKEGIIWNTFGSVANAASGPILLLFITRVCGAEAAGIFSVAYATAQMMMSVGNYGIRAYQVSDIEGKYSFKEYEINRMFSCIFMLICTCFFIVQKAYDRQIAIVVFLMGIYKMIDALADVYEGCLQLSHRLDLAGKSLFFRAVSSVVLFIFILFLTKELIIPSVFAIILSFVLLWGMAYRPTSKQKKEIRKVKKENIFKIFKECFPLFISTILLAYIVNIPKYAIERVMSYEVQTYYSIIYLPAQVIYLLAMFIFKPFLTNLAETYCENIEKFKQYNLKIMGTIVAFTTLAIMGATLLGIPVLELLFGVHLKEYKEALIIILIGGGFNAIAIFLYHVAAIMRIQFVSMFAYIIGTVISFLFADYFVGKWGIIGASGIYTTGMCLITVVMIGGMYLKKQYSLN